MHPRTLELFIQQVKTVGDVNKNLIFEILTHYHLHNWVRQMKIHMHVTWEDRRKVKLKVNTELRLKHHGGWVTHWNRVKEKIFKAAQWCIVQPSY